MINQCDAMKLTLCCVCPWGSLLQWVLNPQSMALPRVNVPEGLAPGAKYVMRTLADLVVACTASEPTNRPSFKEILSTLRGAAAAAAEM